ncbi:restriction endonuclease subunit S [Vibrio alginolyticus]|uniref:restriction endonuclease subunit S n=1 Tax=Vibrio alginolyticus TaxID=663 RepID=UPI001BD6126C|nr:restriction endonuclease subunit S [Vibrio alginolyticus]MBS9996317.1 restriction endonuclease subunit S [Vibrio alginolyticus]
MTGRYKAYPDYKESGVEWLGDVPENWSVHSLKRTVDNVTNGIWGSEPDGENDLIVIRVADFNRNQLNISDDKLTFRSIENKDRKTRLLKKGDLLIEKSGGGDKTLVGCVVLFDKDYEAVTSNFVAKMTPQQGFDSSFLRYAFSYLYAGKVNYSSIKQTTGIQNLDSEAYLLEKLAFPLYEEQQKIANFLDHETAKIDTLIAKQEKLIELLKEKRQAVISHAVTKGLNPDAPMKDSGVEWLGEVPEHWKACPLKTISKFRQGKLHEPYIHEDGKFICVNSRFVSTEGEKFKYCSKNLSPVENEDILMVMSDLPNGRALAKALFVQGDNNFALNQRVCAITATEIDARFLYYQLNRNEYFLSFDDGCNQTNLSNYVFKNFPALVPYKAEQCEIAEYLDRQTESFDRLVEIANRQIELMKERKTALISAAVTGKIDVRDWEGEA